MRCVWNPYTNTYKQMCCIAGTRICEATTKYCLGGHRMTCLSILHWGVPQQTKYHLTQQKIVIFGCRICVFFGKLENMCSVEAGITLPLVAQVGSKHSHFGSSKLGFVKVWHRCRHVPPMGPVLEDGSVEMRIALVLTIQ